MNLSTRLEAIEMVRVREKVSIVIILFVNSMEIAKVMQKEYGI